MDAQLAKGLLWKRRDELVTALSRLNKEMEALEQGMTQELSRYDNHPADLASETYERQKDLGLSQTLRHRLQEVDAALHRLEQGTYGTCVSCGQSIEDDRLEVIPEAEFCLPCQKDYEKHNARRQRPGEEDVIDPARQRQDSVAYEQLDAWEDVAQYGTSSTPEHQPDSPGVDDIRDKDAVDGTIEPVQGRSPRRP